MKTIVGLFVVVTALVFGAADLYAMSGGSKKGGGGGGNGSWDGDTTRYASVPEPSTLYAVGAGLAFLGGAGWYLRRRK